MSSVIDLLHKGLESNPSDWNIRKGIIEHYAGAGDLEGLRGIVESAPSMPTDEALTQEVAGLIAGADAEVGRKFVSKAVEAHPTSAWMHGALAKLHVAAGDMAAAGPHYEAAKAFDPSYSDPDLDQMQHLFVGAEVSESTVAAAPVVEDVQPVQQEAVATPEITEEAVPEAIVQESESVVAGPLIAPLAPPTSDDLVPVEDLPEVASLIDPASVPETPVLNADEPVDPAVDLSFTPSAELELTRSHLTVQDPHGEEHDADELFDSEEEDALASQLLAGGMGDVPAIEKKKDNKEKFSALLITILVHAAIFALIGLIVIAAPRMLPPEITATPGPITNETTVTKKKVAQQTPTKPPAPSASQVKTISSVSSTPVSVPSVEFNAPDAPVELGSNFGNIGFGTMGSSAGGNISFMGASGSGSRVVFAIDYSRSMSGFSEEENQMLMDGKTPDYSVWRKGKKVLKHMMVRDELIKSIKKLPEGTQYQVVMFSQFAWAHDAIDTDWLTDPEIIKDKSTPLLQKLRKAGDDSREVREGKGKDQVATGEFEFPKYSYLTTNPDNVKKSVDIIARTPTTYGTNWEQPILMALSIRPKPDIIFFMTDGTVKNPERSLELVAEANEGARTKIHTTAMMEPGAAKQLSDLATSNGGNFTIVMDDGDILKGEDFFKGAK